MTSVRTQPVPDLRDERERLRHDFVETVLRLDPVTASFAGEHAYDHQFPDWSPVGLEAGRDVRASLRHRLRAASGRDERGPGFQHDWVDLDLSLMDAWLEIQLAEDASRHFIRGNPSLAVGEALFGLVSLAWDDHTSDTARRSALEARLAAIPGFLEGAERSCSREVPQAWLDRALRECDGGLDLIADVAAWAAVGNADHKRDSVVKDATAALTKFATTLRTCRVAPPSSYGAGESMLELLVRRGHCCETPLEVLRREAGESLNVERAHLTEMVRGVGAGSWHEVADRLLNSHPSPGSVPETCRRTWDEFRELASGLVTWPGVEMRFDWLPDWASRAAPRLYYLQYRSPAPLRYPAYDRYAVTALPGTPDDGAQAAYWRLWNHSSIRLNHVIHHGGLGHHVQNWHAARSPLVVGRLAAVDAASRIASILGGSMAEGWACYAVSMMAEGNCLTPEEEVSERHTRVRLLARAVVDLDLHRGHMSFDDAVRFHQDVTGMSEATARGEVTKCSMFPGTAMMYWIGLRGLEGMRRSEERRWGTGFDAHAFHDAVLRHGSIPVPLAARLISEGEQ